MRSWETEVCEAAGYNLTIIDRIEYEIAARIAVAGIVSTHAHTMRPAIPQRTAETR
jgi:hypothetical protein